MKLQHPWAPDYSKDSKLLILGTFPSPRSRDMGYYYGHPQNAFWKTLSASLGEPEPPDDVESRRDFAHKHGIALWDVFRSVDIDGASDASIHDAEPNAFRGMIEGSEISAVFTTGRVATEAFNRLCSKEAGMRAIYLPSTSPANRQAQEGSLYEDRWAAVGKLYRGELVSSAGMKELDRRTIEDIGVPSLVLMERAALAVVDVLKEGILEEMLGPGAEWRRPGGRMGAGSNKVVCVCGAGNNGGDGFAVARILHLQGFESEILFVGNPSKMSEETKRQARIADNYGVRIIENAPSAINEPMAIVDALFGIGLERELSGLYLGTAKAINKARRAGTHVLSVDVPSGISADTGEALGGAVAADETVTFAFGKVGLTLGEGLECSGSVSVADIGIYL